MTHRLVHAEVRCQCGKYVNVRMKETTKGQVESVNCWNCGRQITLQNRQGKSDGRKVPTTIVLDETVKDD
jgi:hypothetical protein